MGKRKRSRTYASDIEYYENFGLLLFDFGGCYRHEFSITMLHGMYSWCVCVPLCVWAFRVSLVFRIICYIHSCHTRDTRMKRQWSLHGPTRRRQQQIATMKFKWSRQPAWKRVNVGQEIQHKFKARQTSPGFYKYYRIRLLTSFNLIHLTAYVDCILFKSAPNVRHEMGLAWFGSDAFCITTRRWQS